MIHEDTKNCGFFSENLFQPLNLKKLIHTIQAFDTMLLDTRRLIKINWIKEPEYENMQDVCKIIAKDIIDGEKNSLTLPPAP